MKGDREMSVCEMQNEVERAAREEQAARRELASTLAASVHEAVTGSARPIAVQSRATPGESDRRGGIGAAYCAALGATIRLAGGKVPPPPRGLDDRPSVASLFYSGGQMTSTIEGLRARMADQGNTASSYEVEIQKKFALAVACTVFVLLGAPIALRFPRGGVGLTIGVSLGVFALYYVGLIAGEALADRDMLPPFLAMWAANILFTIVGLFLMARMGREGSTARGGDAGEFVEALSAWLKKQLRRVGVPLDRRAPAV
jgi:hypothetical protein